MIRVSAVLVSSNVAVYIIASLLVCVFSLTSEYATVPIVERVVEGVLIFVLRCWGIAVVFFTMFECVDIRPPDLSSGQ